MRFWILFLSTLLCATVALYTAVSGLMYTGLGFAFIALISAAFVSMDEPPRKTKQ